MPRATKRLLATLGRRARAFREAALMTQHEVAEAAELDLKHYWAIESGRRNVTLATIERIARVLRVQPFELLRPATREERAAPPEVDRLVALMGRLEPEGRELLLRVVERFGDYDTRPNKSRRGVGPAR